MFVSLHLILFCFFCLYSISLFPVGVCIPINIKRCPPHIFTVHHQMKEEGLDTQTGSDLIAFCSEDDLDIELTANVLHKSFSEEKVTQLVRAGFLTPEITGLSSIITFAVNQKDTIFFTHYPPRTQLLFHKKRDVEWWWDNYSVSQSSIAKRLW